MDGLTTEITDYITANPGTSNTDALLAIIAAAIAAEPTMTHTNDALYAYVNA